MERHSFLGSDDMRRRIGGKIKNTFETRYYQGQCDESYVEDVKVFLQLFN